MSRRPWLWDLAAALVLLTVGGLAFRAALPLSQARWGLFMDEKIPFDGVQAILHPSGPKALVRAVVDGGDQRYGRLFFNASALVSAIPERIFGAQGQILATRALQIVAVLSAVALLLIALLPQGPWRLLGALCLVAAAPTEYYLSMPKPEPLQALCLAIFVGYAAWNGWKFGWHWLWLGLSFGLKISVLPALMVFTVVALWRGRLEGLLRASAAFALGWVLAVPVLLAGPQGWKHWASWTIQNTGHGQDDASVSWRAWLPWVSEATAPQGWIAALALALVASLWVAWAWSKDEGLTQRSRSALVVGLAGLAWAALVMLAVKRVWGFYLWIPLLFLHASALGAAAWGWRRGGLLRFASLALGALLAVNAFATGLPRLHAGLAAAAARDQDPEHRYALNDREALRNWLATLKPRDRPWTLHLDPHCYDPDMGPQFQRSDIWGYFNAWEAAPDLVVLGPRHQALENVSATNVEHQEIHARRQRRFEHMASSNGRCAKAPCYRSGVLGRMMVLQKIEAGDGR